MAKSTDRLTGIYDQVLKKSLRNYDQLPFIKAHKLAAFTDVLLREFPSDSCTILIRS